MAVGLYVALVYNRQLAVMQGTLNEMKRSGEQSTQQMWSAISNINWMARSMDWSQKTMQQGSNQTLSKMQGQIDATNQAFYLEQRPWVALSIQEQDLQPGSSTRVVQERIVTRNSGRTPAVHVKFSCITQIPSNSGDEIPDCEELQRKNLESRRKMLEDRYRKLYPGINDRGLQKYVSQEERLDAEFTRKMKARTDKEWMIPPDGTEPLNEGFIQVGNSDSFIYLVGILTYQDLIDRSKTHTTKFCLVKWEQTPATYCRSGQWMN